MTSGSPDAAVECVRAIESAKIMAMSPIARADIRRFIASPDGSLLAASPQHTFPEREKLHLEFQRQLSIDTIRLPWTIKLAGSEI
jgi:hypothetical protein